MRVRGSPAGGWTGADQAELDVLMWELVNGWYGHQEAGACDGGCTALSCPRLGDGIRILVEWRQGRALRTRAERLRAGQDLLDFAALLGYGPDEVRKPQRRWLESDESDEMRAAA